MQRTRTRTLLTAAVITAFTLATAMPAAAAPVTRSCGGNGQVTGDVTSAGAVTYEQDRGDCGTVSVRAKYSHIGGASWTSWKSGQFAAQIQVKNAFQGHHRTSRPAIEFYTTR
jgi:hypothetical protein